MSLCTEEGSRDWGGGSRGPQGLDEADFLHYGVLTYVFLTLYYLDR